MYAQATAPRTLAQLLESALSLFRHTFLGILPLTPIAVGAAVILNVFTLTHALPEEPAALLVMPGYRPALFGASILAVLSYGVLLAKMDFLARGEPMGTLRAVGIGLRAWPTMLGASLLLILALTLGLMLFIIPGVIASVSLAMYGPLVMVEGRGVFASLKESFELVRGSWWYVAAAQLAGMLPVLLFAEIVFAVTSIAIGAPPVNGARLAFALLVAAVVTVITSPLLAALVLETYYELKLRRRAVTRP